MDVFPIGAVLSVLVDNPGDVRTVHTGFAIDAVFSRLAFFSADDGGGDSLFTICSCYTILAVDANGTGKSVYTVFPCLAHGYAVSRDVFVHKYMDGGITLIILFYRGN